MFSMHSPHQTALNQGQTMAWILISDLKGTGEAPLGSLFSTVLGQNPSRRCKSTKLRCHLGPPVSLIQSETVLWHGKCLCLEQKMSEEFPELGRVWVGLWGNKVLCSAPVSGSFNLKSRDFHGFIDRTLKSGFPFSWEITTVIKLTWYGKILVILKYPVYRYMTHFYDKKTEAPRAKGPVFNPSCLV